MRTAAARFTCLPVALLLALAPAARAEDPVAAFTAFAVNVSAPLPSGASTVDIVIERWSTDEENERLMTAFVENGEKGLLREIQRVDPRVGFMRTPNSIGYDLRYAKEFPNPDGGRRIILITDRRIGLWEARNRPRTIDYPFTVVEMRLDAKGEGEGKLSLLARIIRSFDGKTIELENYTQQPVQLNNIRPRR